MGRADSSGELGGKVAAALTARAPHVHTPRDSQSSGFFDLDALYAVHVEQGAAAKPAAPATPAPATAAPSSTAPTLEDLIRREVASESKRARPASSP